jgi:hypothetical protein
MPDEFRIEVGEIERPEGGSGRVHLRLITPDGIEGRMVDGQLLRMYARELGSRVELPARRRPWGDGVRQELKGDAAAVELRGLTPAHQVQLDRLARESADVCNRDLGRDGTMGSRLHEIVERFGPD